MVCTTRWAHRKGKAVRVLQGSIWDVAVDLRRESATFGRWEGFPLSAAELKLLWIPEGFAHGFLVLSGRAEVLYKTTGFYNPGSERTIVWNDPSLRIDWPLARIDQMAPIVSPKDRDGVLFPAADYF